MADRSLYVCENGHIQRSKTRVKLARICRVCRTVIPNSRRCPKGIDQARNLAELTLTLMTPKQIKASKLDGKIQIFSKGRVRWVKDDRPLMLDFDGVQQGELL